jgi:hypothetical protein
LHTDSFSSSLWLVGKFAGELGVRFLTVTYGTIKISMRKRSEERSDSSNKGDEQRERSDPSDNEEEKRRKKRLK